MIYAASLSIQVKKAMGNKSVQSSINKIISNLTLDPKVTTMDTVILCPKDVVGPKAREFSAALEHRHPDICVIYIYTKDNERDLVSDDVYKMHAKKIKDVTINKALEEFLGDHAISTGMNFVSNADFRDISDDSPVEQPIPRQVEEPAKHRGLFGTKKSQRSEKLLEGAQEYVDSITNERVSYKNRAQIPTESVPVATERVSDENIMNTFAVPEESTEEVTEVKDAAVEPIETESEPTIEMPSLDEMMAAIKDEESEPEPEKPEVPMATSDVNAFLHPVIKAQEEVHSYEENLERIRSADDWDKFKESLEHDSIMKRLLEANSEFSGLVTMLDILDQRIQAVFRDTNLTADQKFDQIKSIGLERATARAASNSIYVDKLVKTIEAITCSAKRTVEEKISDVTTAMSQLAVSRSKISDTSNLDELIQKRSKVQAELLELTRGLIDLYKAMDLAVTEEIKDLDAKLPSNNAYINNMMSPIGTHIFTPSNTAALANNLLQALAANRLTASQLENSITATIDVLFTLCATDENIIQEQQKTIELLKANRVEDVVIVDSVLKSALRVFVGTRNSGLSATAITWSGVQSRQQNALLVDLTGSNKFATYGIDAVPMDKFLHERIENHFTCVYTERPCALDEFEDIIKELRTRLNYYPYINIILCAEQVDLLNRVSDDSFCVHYVTNCTTGSMDALRDTVASHTNVDNIARKLVTIGAPVSPFMIAGRIGLDLTKCKLVVIPEMPAIKGCAIRNDRPYEYDEIVSVFEEAIK